MPARPSWPFPSLPRPAQVLLCCTLSLLAFPRLASAGRGPALETIPEWVHLSVVWNTLTDHSSGLLFSQERLHELVPDVDRANADLAALVARKALPADTAAVLLTVLQERYRYVEAHCYGPSLQQEVTRLEGSEAASHWVVEMQLDLLRQPLANGSLTAVVQSDQKRQHAVRASLTNELSFLWQCRAARDEFSRRRQELDAKEARGEEVDRTRVDLEWARRQQALVDTYQQRRVRADRAIERLVPYLIRLTLTPSPAPQVEESAPPPLFPY